MELINNLGINGKLLLAQIVNFLILLYVLHRFAYKPILKILNERTRKIEEGLSNSEEARKKLLEITEKEKQILNSARKEAHEIINKVQAVASADSKRLAEESEATSKRMIEEARQEIQREKEQIVKEAKEEIGELVILATSKVIGEKLNSEKDKKLIEEVIK